MHIAFLTTPNLTTLIIPITLGIVLIIALFLIIRLETRLNRLFVGKDALNLEDSIYHINQDVKSLYQFTHDMEEYLTTVETRLKKSVQAVETVRFNPFKGTGSGGNNSFSSTFLNEKGDGIILTGLYARDRVSIFAKAVKNFKSDNELSDEEEESLKMCQKSIKAV